MIEKTTCWMSRLKHQNYFPSFDPSLFVFRLKPGGFETTAMLHWRLKWPGKGANSTEKWQRWISMK